MKADFFRSMISSRQIARASACLLTVIAFSSPRGASASDGEEGIEVLKNFLRTASLPQGESILGVAGFFGQPLPPQWLVLTGDPAKPGPLRESVCARGKILAERKFSPLPGQDLPTHLIAVDSVKVGSGRAFKIAESRAGERRVRFDSAHFQLRVRDSGLEPVWMLHLLNRGQVTVGTIYLSAVDGRILRESWPTPASPEPLRFSAR